MRKLIRQQLPADCLSLGKDYTNRRVQELYFKYCLAYNCYPFDYLCLGNAILEGNIKCVEHYLNCVDDPSILGNIFFGTAVHQSQLEIAKLLVTQPNFKKILPFSDKLLEYCISHSSRLEYLQLLIDTFPRSELTKLLSDDDSSDDVVDSVAHRAVADMLVKNHILDEYLQDENTTFFIIPFQICRGIIGHGGKVPPEAVGNYLFTLFEEFVGPEHESELIKSLIDLLPSLMHTPLAMIIERYKEYLYEYYDWVSTLDFFDKAASSPNLRKKERQCLRKLRRRLEQEFAHIS